MLQPHVHHAEAARLEAEAEAEAERAAHGPPSLVGADFGATSARRSPPASSSSALSLSASSFSMPSLTGLGASSTRALASLRPRPVAARTTLMTWIFLSPAAGEDHVERASAPPRAGAVAAGSAAGGRGRGGDRGRRDAELLLERLDALGELEHRDALELVDPLLRGGHGVLVLLRRFRGRRRRRPARKRRPRCRLLLPGLRRGLVRRGLGSLLGRVLDVGRRLGGRLVDGRALLLGLGRGLVVGRSLGLASAGAALRPPLRAARPPAAGGRSLRPPLRSPAPARRSAAAGSRGRRSARSGPGPAR